MDDKINKDSFLAIKGALEINFNSSEDTMEETEMIIQIERRVAEMMDKDMDLLLSYLYRLDISENRINACLNPASPFHPYTCLATLIWERQKERVRTKKYYKSGDQIDEDWQW